MAEDREEYLLETEKKLLELTVKELHRVCEYCAIAGKDNELIQGKSRRALVKHVIKFCERDELLAREDEGMSVLFDLNDTLDAMLESRLETGAAGSMPLVSSPAVGEGEEKAIQAANPTSTAAQAADISSREQRDGTSLPSPLHGPAARGNGTQRRCRELLSSCCVSSAHSNCRKDFRINGHVGESNSKDGLSFSSLEHQIENGLRKGYPDVEIVEAVIRSVSAGLKLRSYLEGKTDLTLATLRKILGAHYAEKDATVLYQQLTEAVQGPYETSLDFLVRVLDLRQKVLFASERAQSGPKYNKELVHSQCFQSIMTGLSNDNVRAEMRMYLQNENSSDELLLQKMQIAQHNENERAQKIKATNKVIHKARLTVVEASEEDTNHLTTSPSAKPTKPFKENPLFTKLEESNTAIRELTGQVALLVQSAKHERKTTNDHPTKQSANVFKRPKRRCVACQQDGIDCKHCFKCGSDTHWAKGCRVGEKQKPQGNGQRL